MQPHDHLFRFVFSQPEHATGLLQTALPHALSMRVEWATLAAISGSFVDPSLNELRSDLLFSATVGGRRVLFYILLEHQSTSDRFMLLRLLGYMQRIWEQERREHPEARLLPVIVPIVVSHDVAGWSAPRSFAELLNCPVVLSGEMRPHMVDFEMLVDDLSEARDDELRRRVMSDTGRLALFLLKRARTSDDIVGELLGWVDLLRAVMVAPNGIASLTAFMRYISKVTDTRSERLRAVVQALGPASKVALMNAAEEWEMQGEARGMAKGKAEGRAEGVLSVLDARGLAITASDRERILACGDLEVLDRWLRRAVTAAAVQDVLAD